LLQSAHAQSPPPDSRDSTAKPPPAQPAGPGFAFSGVLFANYQYGGAQGNRSQNRFEIERAYLNFRARPGERDSIRVTADVFQQRDTTRDGYYRGWAFRAKYAYFQHDFLRGGRDHFRLNAKLGLLQTVVVEKEETIWLRGLSQTAVEQAGFFASSDAGLAGTLTLPSGWGELYATIVNGSGYTSRELDRFKDYAARLTLSPLARFSGYLQALQISPWFSVGSRASDFATRKGTVRPVTEGRRRDRYGVLVTLRDPNLSFGLQLARRKDVVETADTTVDLAPVVSNRAGRVVSFHTIVRPLAFAAPSGTSPFWIVFRADQFKPSTTGAGYQRFWVTGLSWDLNARASLTLDLQSGYPQHGLAGPNTRVVFLHLIANY
jgi:hypothetical protein